MMESVIRLVEAMGIWGWIAIVVVVGIICEAVVVMRKMQIKHDERMSKIASGMDPGDEVEAYKKDEV